MNFRRVVISEFGEPKVLKVVEEENLPEPKAGEVRVRVLKVSANFTDVMIRKGKYPEVREKPPFSPGYDMVGVVDKLGKGASVFMVGQRVADLTIIGSYAEYICLSEGSLTLLPKGLDASEASTLILSYMTAYQMLHRVAKVSEGQRILVHAASGAVGIAMLQLGKLLHLKMYGTASKAKHDLVINNGGIPIDYQREDFEEQILKQSGDGVDAVFDPIGGEYFKKSFNILNSGGRLVAFGFYNAVMGKGGNMVVEFFKLLLWNILPNKKKTSFYIITRMRKKHPAWFKEDLTSLFKLLEEGKIKPEISGHFPLEKAEEVHRMIEKTELRGKVVFDIGKE